MAIATTTSNILHPRAEMATATDGCYHVNCRAFRTGNRHAGSSCCVLRFPPNSPVASWRRAKTEYERSLVCLLLFTLLRHRLSLPPNSAVARVFKSVIKTLSSARVNHRAGLMRLRILNSKWRIPTTRFFVRKELVIANVAEKHLRSERAMEHELSHS